MNTVTMNRAEGCSRWTRLLGSVLMVALSTPIVALPQSTRVDLGTAGNFVVLAQSGISTTGVTAVTGDMGVSPSSATAITGFGLIMHSSGTYASSSMITGNVYASDYTVPTPTTMTTAIADMQTAFTNAAGRTLPDHTELFAGDVTGQTLTPGLYKWGTGVLISAGGVTISGSPDEIWVFQVAQDLTVANGAIVTLSGGAQAANIFWQVEGATTIGTTAAMKGIILCKTQIAFNTGATLDGRALAQTAVTLDGNAITQPTLITGVAEGSTPEVFTLSQNYPNPFNPSTTIDYTLASPGMVSLKVYNVLGTEVASLVQGHQDAGSHSVSFGTTEGVHGLATGVYFYRLEAGMSVAMKKLVLIK